MARSFVACLVVFAVCFASSARGLSIPLNISFALDTVQPAEVLVGRVLDALRDEGGNITALPNGLSTNSTAFERVQAVLMNYDPTVAERAWWIDLCEPVWRETKYSRIQVHNEPGVMNMLLLCWDAKSASPVHSHGGHRGIDSQCFIRVLNGQLTERIYELPPNGTLGEELHQISTRVAALDTVTFMNDDIGIHDIHSTDRTVTIHLYIPGYTEVYSMVPTKADTVHLVQTKYQAVLKGQHMQLSPEYFRVVSVD